MKTKLNFSIFWLATFALLVLGCSKSETKPAEPPVITDRIILSFSATYPAGINITQNKATLSVAGQGDLVYFVTPGKDTSIMISGAQAECRQGKPATVTMNCEAKYGEGNVVPICYNYADGKVEINSLLSDNPRIVWIGNQCSPSGDQVILRVKITFHYDFNPPEYTVINGGFSFGVAGDDEHVLWWSTSADVDTVIILSGEAATSRLGKEFYVQPGFNAINSLGGVTLGYVPDCIQSFGTLLPDNPKIEIVGYGYY